MFRTDGLKRISELGAPKKENVIALIAACLKHHSKFLISVLPSIHCLLSDPFSPSCQSHLTKKSILAFHFLLFSSLNNLP